MINKILIISVTFFVGSLSAQGNGLHYNDTAIAHYDPEYINQDTNLTVIEGTFIARPYLRKADEKFRRRVWRVIDLRQKLNKSWTWPRNPLANIFWELGTKGLCRAYNSDSLRSIITPEGILARCNSESLEKTLNWDVDPQTPGIDLSDPNNYHDTTISIIFKWEMIHKFEIMEDWIFDYKHGEMRPVIIAISPIRDVVLEVNKVKNTVEDRPFWLKMDDCRPTLAKSQVFNRYNDAMRLNWDQQINGLRLFDSYIVKTTDYDDRYLNSKKEFSEDPVALLLESEKIKNDLFIFEHDLWEY
jgi:gliding motility associated protien GldN